MIGVVSVSIPENTNLFRPWEAENNSEFQILIHCVEF